MAQEPSQGASVQDMLCSSQLHLDALEAVQKLSIADTWIAAGAVRNVVWDCLHGRPPSEPRDFDVVFHDAVDRSRRLERQVEMQLSASMPRLNWEVVNQARVHAWAENMGRKMEPVVSAEDGIRRFPETATCVGARLVGEKLEVFAPYGTEDLFALVLRRAPLCPTWVFNERIATKGWLSRWPNLRVEQ